MMWSTSIKPIARRARDVVHVDKTVLREICARVVGRALPDGHDDAVGLQFEGGSFDRNGPPAPVLVGLALRGALASQADHTAVAREHLEGHDLDVQSHALVARALHLVSGGGHLPGRATVENRDVLRAEPESRARAVHGRVSAADDEGALAHVGPLCGCDLLEQIHDVHDAGRAVALDLQAPAPARSEAEEHCVEAVQEKALRREVFAKPLARPQRRSESQDVLHVALDDVPGQAEGRDGRRKEPAGPVPGL
ncbi:MAG: hypothetical protein JRG91_11155, partial [Deltaproteobacteria bacterium]|nr:hypothetical protein [Deltaproteobacteria bacterium]